MHARHRPAPSSSSTTSVEPKETPLTFGPARRRHPDRVSTNGRDGAVARRDASLVTVAYADVFDFVLTLWEIHRDLVGVQTTFDETQQAVEALVAEGQLIRKGDYLALAGREHLFPIRRWRQQRRRELWPTARRIGE